MIIFIESIGDYSVTTNIKFGSYDFEIETDYLRILEYKNKSEEHYRSFTLFKEKLVLAIPITQINHKIRKDKTEIFKDGENAEGLLLTKKERIMNIFSGFENGINMKPIILYREEKTEEFMNFFELYDGCHRLHCSIAYGFKSIPAIIYKKEELKVC
jgi:hypothetical protein